MPNKDLVVIGASTGGIEALRCLVRGLPKDYPGSILIVVHTGPSSPNVLDKILAASGDLPASNAEDYEEIKPGHIYVAPADRHLLLEPCGFLRLSRGPKENRFRPAVDPLFRSAAYAFGERVVGVVLSGWLDDGTAGMWAVKECGGTAIVQHPENAIASAMPLNALKHVEVDHCVPIDQIAPLLVQLSQTSVSPAASSRPMSKLMELEVKIAQEDNALESGIMEVGEPSPYACPECHGVLLQLKEGSNVRFRCHTGHAYSIETLLSEFNEQTEDTLWNAIRSIEESVLLLRQMGDHLDKHEHAAGAALLRRKADEAQDRALLVRQAVMKHEKVDPDRAGGESAAAAENHT